MVLREVPPCPAGCPVPLWTGQHPTGRSSVWEAGSTPGGAALHPSFFRLLSLEMLIEAPALVFSLLITGLTRPNLLISVQEILQLHFTS